MICKHKMHAILIFNCNLFACVFLFSVPAKQVVIKDAEGNTLQGVIGPFDEGDALKLVCEAHGGKCLLIIIDPNFLFSAKSINMLLIESGANVLNIDLYDFSIRIQS